MEFLDEDARPRFLFQARPPPPTSSLSDQDLARPNKLFLSIFIAISLVLFFLSIFFLQTEPFKSLLLWFSLSLLVGPFAPASLTGGHIRVGHGPVIEQEPSNQQIPDIDQESKKKPAHKRSKPQRPEYAPEIAAPIIENANRSLKKEDKSEDSRRSGDGLALGGEVKEWSEEDIEILKKQTAKNPPGKPGRWEAIAEAFKGRHRVENVIKKAKELGEKKLDDGDAYERFLKNRKPLDTRIHEAADESTDVVNGEKETGGVSGGSQWSSGEDIALLNALKSFPKDVSMRWEKISAAVPGKSKVACMKRVSELKRTFRSSKACAED